MQAKLERERAMEEQKKIEEEERLQNPDLKKELNKLRKSLDGPFFTIEENEKYHEQIDRAKEFYNDGKQAEPEVIQPKKQKKKDRPKKKKDKPSPQQEQWAFEETKQETMPFDCDRDKSSSPKQEETEVIKPRKKKK